MRLLLLHTTVQQRDQEAVELLLLRQDIGGLDTIPLPYLQLIVSVLLQSDLQKLDAVVSTFAAPSPSRRGE